MHPKDILPPGRSFEARVADIYRQLGAVSVIQDVIIAGNQIDIYIEEETESGSKIRTAVECKARRRPLGKDIVNKFALVFEALKRAGLVDSGAIISTSGFTRFARGAAKEANLNLIELKDLEIRIERARKIVIYDVKDMENFIAVPRGGPVIAARHRSSDRKVIESPSEADYERLRIMYEYTVAIDNAANNPTGPLVSIDLTGMHHDFSNWLQEPMFRAVLYVNKKYLDAFKRRHGESLLGVRRNFAIDPNFISGNGIKRLEETLRTHYAYNIEAGIFYCDHNDPRAASVELTDMAVLTNRIAVDAGNLYGTPTREFLYLNKLKDKSLKAKFKRLRDKAGWTLEKSNLDLIVRAPEDIDLLIRDLHEKKRTGTGNQR